MSARITGGAFSSIYAQYMTDEVSLTFMGADRAVAGREAARQLITFIHEQAFKTAVRVKSVVCGVETPRGGLPDVRPDQAGEMVDEAAVKSQRAPTRRRDLR